MGTDREAPAASVDDGVFSVIWALSEIEDLEEAAGAYGQAVKDAYWVDKDVQAAVGIGYAGASRLLAAADGCEEEVAHDLRSSAKSILYNIASFAWVGWDEPGIEVTASDAAAGLQAARINLGLAGQLGKEPIARSRAHWMVGAHLLTGGDPAAAVEEFDRAASLAETAGSSPDFDLSDAFAGLAELVFRGDVTRMEAALGRLQEHEHGDEFCGQVATARRVLDV